MSLAHSVQAVQVSAGELTLPSRPAAAGRLPTVGRVRQDRPVYPYRLLNELDYAALTPRTFRALRLENEFLALTVLPELGGRLHRALFKPANYDLFYHNDAIRAQLVSSRGAWYAGGVEFNFPTSHSLTTHAGVEYQTETGDDGSAAVVIANTDRMSQMRWWVSIRLCPGSTAIHFRTRLYNRTAWPHRYYYWLNAAVPQGPQIRYHFSASRLIGHAQDVDGVRTRTDNFPMLRNGSDARHPAKLLDTTSIFMLDNHSGFFGYYDVDADLGLVRSAPVRTVPGNKIWSWGDTDYGRRFNRRLVPPDGQFYGELQSGRPESQTDWAIIEPFEMIEADEVWYPIPRLGGMTDGSADATLLAEPAAGRIRLVANRPMPNLTVRVESASAPPGRPLVERNFEAVPAGEPIQLNLPPTDKPLRVRATDSAGRCVLDCAVPIPQADSIICDLYEHKANATLSASPTAHELTVRAVAAYRAYELDRAERYCRAALEREPAFGPALRWQGFFLRRAGRFDEAIDSLKAALLSDPMDYAAYYQYAALLAETGRLEEAALELERVIGYAHGQCRAWAAVLLARCLLALGRTDAVRQLLAEWPGEAAFGALGRVGYRVGLAPDGRSRWWGDATDLFVQVVESSAADALDAWWARNVKAGDEAADAVREVAEEFLAAGDAARAKAVLEWLVNRPELAKVCPLAHYRLGQLAGELAAAVARAASLTDRDRMAWPGRLTDQLLLAEACRAAPDDALAHALAGLFKLALGRSAEAVELLGRAARLDPSDALAWRNLGLARWTAGQDWQTCLSAYERAVALWPDYGPLVAEADAMLAALGGPPERRRRLIRDDLHASLGDDSGIAVRRAELDLVRGDYEAGLADLVNRRFHPGEGKFDTQHLFERLHIRRGEQLAGKGDWAAALVHFRQAMEYPDNIGIGRPRRVQEARQHYLAAMAMDKLGDPAAARAELEQLLRLCLWLGPMECYFGILAMKRLGQDAAAEQRLAQLDRQAAARAADPADEDRYWARFFAAMAARARGDRTRSNELLAELKPRPGDPLTDLLDSRLY